MGGVIILINYKYSGYNEGPRDWQNLFAIMRFHYIEVVFHMVYYYRGN